MLFELLTGLRPFTGSSPHAIGQATLHHPVPPLRQLNPQVDVELQRMVNRCLEKRMSDRYDSVATFLEDLDEWLRCHRDRTSESAPPRATSGGENVVGRQLVARGLSPFNEEDAEIYLPLIPGPRDRRLQTQRQESFASIARQLAEAPTELLLPLRDFAASSQDGTPTLLEVAEDLQNEAVLRHRAAILLLSLGNSAPVVGRLRGNNDCLIDSEFWLESTRWRDDPRPWVELLRTEDDPDVRYHTLLLLSTYPREALADEQDELDLSSLLNSRSAKVHAAARFLLAHLGGDPHAINLDPPADADSVPKGSPWCASKPAD